MYSNRRRQGNGSRYANHKNAIQKPTSPPSKPFQIVPRPSHVSPGEKLNSLPLLPPKPKPTHQKQFQNQPPPTQKVSPHSIAKIIDPSNSSSRRKPRGNRPNDQSTSVSPHSDHSPSPSRRRAPENYSTGATNPGKYSHSQRTTPLTKKDEAAVELLMVLLHPEDQQKFSSPVSPPPSHETNDLITPQSLFQLLSSTPTSPAKRPPTTSSRRPPPKANSSSSPSDNYYAAPLFRKPPTLSDLPLPPFLAC